MEDEKRVIKMHESIHNEVRMLHNSCHDIQSECKEMENKLKVHAKRLELQRDKMWLLIQEKHNETVDENWTLNIDEMTISSKKSSSGQDGLPDDMPEALKKIIRGIKRKMEDDDDDD